MIRLIAIVLNIFFIGLLGACRMCQNYDEPMQEEEGIVFCSSYDLMPKCEKLKGFVYETDDYWNVWIEPITNSMQVVLRPPQLEYFIVYDNNEQDFQILESGVHLDWTGCSILVLDGEGMFMLSVKKPLALERVRRFVVCFEVADWSEFSKVRCANTNELRMWFWGRRQILDLIPENTTR